MSHQWLSRSSKSLEKFVDHSFVRGFACDHWLVDVSVANLSDLPHRALQFEAVDDRLNGGIGCALPLGKALLNFTDRGPRKFPHNLHHFQFKFRQLHVLFPEQGVSLCLLQSSLILPQM